MRLKEGNKESDILEAAIRVFARYGFHEAKISMIATEAGVSAGSVYVYYENKEDQLLEIFRQIWDKLYKDLNLIAERRDLNPVEKFDSLIDLLFDFFIENPSLALVFVNEQPQVQRLNKKYSQYSDKFLALGEDIVREGLTSSHFKQDIDIKILRSYIFGALRHLLQQWAQHPKEYPLNTLRNNVKFLSKHGIMK